MTDRPAPTSANAHTDVVGYAERASFYAVEYDETEDRAFLEAMVSETSGPILEIPCGAGRNALWLARSGREVVFADLEPAMLSALRARFPKGRVPGNVRLCVQDMRAIDWHHKFKLIIVPREAFQLLPAGGEREALAALGDALEPGGRLLIDLFDFYSVGTGKAPALLAPGYYDPGLSDGRETWEWTKADGEGGQLARFRTQWHEAGGTVRIRFRYRRESGAGESQFFESDIELRCFRPEDLVEMAREVAPVKVHAVWGDYAGSAYTRQSSRIILCFERSST